MTVPPTTPTATRAAVINGYGGPEYPYRLIVAADQTDFQLTATPGAPSIGPFNVNVRGPQATPKNDAVNLTRGSTAVITVSANRLGYTGPITLHVERLAEGMTAPDTTIDANQTQGTVVVKVAEDAPPTAALLRVVGTADMNGQTMRRTATNQVNLADLGAPANIQTFDALAIGITEAPTALVAKVDLPLPRVAGVEPLIQGTTQPLKITLVRDRSVAGPIFFRSLNQLPGVGVPQFTPLPRGKDDVTIPITVQAGAPTGPRAILLQAQTTQNKDPVPC